MARTAANRSTNTKVQSLRLHNCRSTWRQGNRGTTSHYSSIAQTDERRAAFALQDLTSAAGWGPMWLGDMLQIGVLLATAEGCTRHVPSRRRCRQMQRSPCAAHIARGRYSGKRRAMTMAQGAGSGTVLCCWDAYLLDHAYSCSSLPTQHFAHQRVTAGKQAPGARCLCWSIPHGAAQAPHPQTPPSTDIVQVFRPPYSSSSSSPASSSPPPLFLDLDLHQQQGRVVSSQLLWRGHAGTLCKFTTVTQHQKPMHCR